MEGELICPQMSTAAPRVVYVVDIGGLSLQGLPFVSGATGKHPFRIYVSYGAGLDQNVG